MVFNRKEYMKQYYQKNQEKLKKYSSNYKQKKKGIVFVPVEIKRGSFLVSFS
jgi:hypothetical protein